MSDSRKLDIPPPPPLDMRYRRALQSMRALFADPDDTEKAVDFFYAIGRREFERSFQRFAATRAGRALLIERPSLPAAMSDREALARMPEASFGREYLGFLDRNGFAAMGLLELQKQVEAKWEAEEGVPRLDPARAYFRERFLLSHDLYHVLTGYGTDDVGEATLLAFSLAQFPGRAVALLTAGAAVEVWKELGARWLRYAFQAWRRGRRAVRLPTLPWEDLLALPLETVRDLAAVEPGERAHPGGILRGRIRPPRAMASV